MSLTDIITVLSFHSHNHNHNYQNRLWKETEIKQVIEYLTDKKTLCGKTNALINTYFANGEKDESMEHIGEQLMERYDYAEKYLTQLQSIIMQSIDKNKQAIKAEKKRVKEVINVRARSKSHSISKTYTTSETKLLERINYLPEFVVLHIKSYLPKNIILCSISIVPNTMKELLSSAKQLNIQKVYNCIRKKIFYIEHKLYILSDLDIIWHEDFTILKAGSPGKQKQGLIARILEICDCYHKVWNVLIRVKPSTSKNTLLNKKMSYCVEAIQILFDELSYIYKLINYATKPQWNKRIRKTIHSPPNNPPNDP